MNSKNTAKKKRDSEQLTPQRRRQDSSLSQKMPKH